MTMTALGGVLPGPDGRKAVPLPGPVDALPADLDADHALATLAYAVISIDSAGVALGVADMRVLKSLAAMDPETVAVLASLLYRSLTRTPTPTFEDEGADPDA